MPANGLRDGIGGSGELLLRGHLLLGFVPGTDLEAAAHPAEPFRGVGGHVGAAHGALASRQLVALQATLGLFQNLRRDDGIGSRNCLSLGVSHNSTINQGYGFCARYKSTMRHDRGEPRDRRPGYRNTAGIFDPT